MLKWFAVSLYLVACVASLLVVSTAGPARAEFLGDSFRPFVSLSETYDSNIFRVKNGAQLKALLGDDRLSDFITVASVGAGMRFHVSQQELDLVLKKEFIRFAHYTGQDVDRDQVSGTLFLTASDRVKVTLEGSYLKLPQPRTEFRSARPNVVTNVSEGITAAYLLPSGFGFDASYRRSSVDYLLPELKANEYVADRYSATAFYVSPVGGKVYTSYQHEELNYNQQVPVDNSSSADSVRFGVEKSVGAKTYLSGFIGYLYRRHAADSAQDFSGVVGKAGVTYAATEKLKLSLSWERQLYEETYTDVIYSVNNALALGVGYRISEKLNATLSDRVSWKNFRTVSGVAGREDFMQEFGTGVEWTPVNRVSVNLGYQYSTRHSNSDLYDFNAHSVSGGVMFRF